MLHKINAIVSSFSPNDALGVDGFHPDLFLPLLRSLNQKIVVVVQDDLFGVVYKYLSSLWDDPSAVFVSSPGFWGEVPSGFVSTEKMFFRRSKELLANGTGPIKTIVCSRGGMSVPVVGSGVGKQLIFRKGVSFDDCLEFLSAEGYCRVDFVGRPGEYSTRGGIIDLYPFSSVYPCRINFLDDVPSIFRFNVDTQLTISRIKNFSLCSNFDDSSRPLCDVSLNRFLPLILLNDGRLRIGFGKSSTQRLTLRVFTHRQFVRKKSTMFSSINVLEDLSSVAVVHGRAAFIPGWFGEKKMGSLRKNIKDFTFSPLEMSEIKPGDFLVHRDHGVGECLGLILKEGARGVQELLAIKYGDGGILSIDTGRLDLVGFFASAGTDGVSLDSLSKRGAWNRKMLSAKKRANEVVQHLLSLYIKRSDMFRPPFKKDVGLEKQFLSEFPYDDTPDQVLAWEDISEDLASNSPMERLLCGDVGFGKTELAIRAAFRAVLSNKRVVVLAPTTILASQLYSSFSARLESNAVSVNLVSRFRSKKDLTKIKESIIKEKNDVLVGTHAILNNDIYLNNIGLLIVDEEHRFGVVHKEKIKRFKAGVDVLSMSATPIPRSINLALSGIYSVSMLQSPPRLRMPINTRIEYYCDNLIKEAIDFEAGRGGQVYFVHNDIGDIKNVAHRIQGLCSGLFVEFIHGQEPSRSIEKKMSLFVSGKIDVLVCTSIIESGIDVPNANCIIINNSNLFGLSQLYQMRGRVGRGPLQAYAYLLVSRRGVLPKNAFKRIKTIEENTRLGSGYSVSLSDMELRGSGSLFGYKQSGGHGSLGYEMYARLIQRALHKSGNLSSGFRILPEDVKIELYARRFIPENYISVESVRMSVYKNIASASIEKELDEILNHLIDRFGSPPVPLINLLNESRLRLRAAFAGVNSVVLKGCGVVCSVGGGGVELSASAVINYAERYFKEQGVSFHVLPAGSLVLSLCVHFIEKQDSYSFFSRFFDKFMVLVEPN